MYLKKLELQGFKSFADKTVLDFMPGITTVIGPNGSGKSNISDSIRWVLGEQSIKSLRGTKSEDIIFAGTQSRKSLGFAEASIVIDNTDGKLPIEFNEVTVTRRIYRNGENGFFINKTPCRLKDVTELFMDTGIGKDGYSVIGQGKIDEMLSSKPDDRRHIFEEAAGIVKYRVRKHETEKKLEQTKINLLRINDILSEIEVNIEPLKAQSEKAKQFLNLREELKNIEIGLFIHNIDNCKEKLLEVDKNSSIFVGQKEDEEKILADFYIEKENLKIKIDELIRQVDDMQNMGIEKLKSQEKLNSDINVLKEKFENNNINEKRYKEEIVSVNEIIKVLEEEKYIKTDKKSSLFVDKEKFIVELKTKEEELKKITNKLSDKELEIEEQKKKLEHNIDAKYEKTAEISTYLANIDNLEKKEVFLKKDIDTIISEVDATRINKTDIEKEFRKIEDKRNVITKNLQNALKEKEESTIKIKKYEEEINKLSMESRLKDSRLKFLIETEREKEGYNKAVKSLLLATQKDIDLQKGLCGVLANLIYVPKEYQLAIEMTLGQILQNLVTEKDTDAKKFIEYLRKNNLGRASFLPISNIKGKKIDKLTKIDGVIGIAADLVECDNRYLEIVNSLLGKTVIVENMDVAIAFSKKNNYAFKIVTLNGDIINPAGSMTGGSVAQKTVSILGRKKEIETLEKELKNLNDKIKKIEIEKSNFIEGIENVLEETELLEKQMQEIEIEYASLNQKLILIKENISKLEVRLNNQKNELELCTKDKNKQKEDIDNVKKEIEKLEEEIEFLNNEISNYTELNKDNQKHIDDLNFDITNLKISVSSFEESENSINEMVDRINQDILNHTKNIDYKNIQINKIVEDNKIISQNIEQKLLEIEESKKNVENSNNEIEELKQNRIDTNNKLNLLEKDIDEKLKIIDDLKTQISKIEFKKSKIDTELELIVTKLWEEYEITPNNCTDYKKPNNVQMIQKEVNNLRNEIKKLGSINVDSIEEYKQIKERYDFMSEQRLDLETTIAKLKKIISDMTNIMKQQFEEKFKIINKNFGEVFKELFNGGKAELKLENTDNILECGIEIEVQPPGKKLQNMLALSGGEKAFTATALLFSILKINPAPFCVLDEVEAALDDVNVFKFAQYLKKFVKDTQFLVITHRKGTMEMADTVYGITMEENGISKLLSMKLK